MPKKKGENNVEVQNYYVAEYIPDAKEQGLTEVVTVATEKDAVTEKVIGKHRARLYIKFGRDIDEAVALYGKDVVHELYIKAAKVEVQNTCRPIILEGGSLDKVPQTWYLPAVKEETAVSSLDTFLKMATPKQRWEVMCKVFIKQVSSLDDAIAATKQFNGEYPGTPQEYDEFLQKMTTGSES